ncbi:hypothetical protein QT972_09255, partial [Microcoleus sp. herbarium7]|uniref:hypothetical protein n=1 Tax=Microcoleus sp. herbarium7 TaxID=3055435 RepID=UPI002FD0432E
GGAPVPAPPTDDFTGVSDMGATTGGLPLRRMKQPCQHEGKLRSERSLNLCSYHFAVNCGALSVASP